MFILSTLWLFPSRTHPRRPRARSRREMNLCATHIFDAARTPRWLTLFSRQSIVWPTRQGSQSLSFIHGGHRNNIIILLAVIWPSETIQKPVSHVRPEILQKVTAKKSWKHVCTFAGQFVKIRTRLANWQSALFSERTFYAYFSLIWNCGFAVDTVSGKNWLMLLQYSR